MRGICLRCAKVGNLIDKWPLSEWCYRKHTERPKPYNEYLALEGEGLPEIARFSLAPSMIGARKTVKLNFIPVHAHYCLDRELVWKWEGQNKIGQLELALNIMAIAFPPDKPREEGEFVKLAGGSWIRKDIWNLHHFFRSEFLEEIQEAGGSVNIASAREWIETKVVKQKTLFELYREGFPDGQEAS